MKKFSDMNEADVAAYLTMLGDCIADILPLNEDGTGRANFMIILSGDNGPGEGHYVSSVERSGAIKWLRETADRLESRQDYNTRNQGPTPQKEPDEQST